MNPTNERSNKEELPRSRHFGILLFKTPHAAVDYMGAAVSRTQCVLDIYIYIYIYIIKTY